MKTYSRFEKFFIFFAMLSVFFVCGEYAVSRPTSNALFLTLFSSKAYPFVWLATVPLNLSVIYLYNRFLPKIGPLSILWVFALATMGINSATALFYHRMPEWIFFQYAWKDIYVLLMLKQIWSMIHATIPSDKAKFLYGCIYGFGTIGAIIGSLVPGFLAPILGSERLLFLTLPIYAALLFCYTSAFKRSGVAQSSFQKELTPDTRPREAFSLISRSPVLIAVLLLVVLMQVSVGLIEYRFNIRLELNILEKDLRTAYCGKLMGIVNGLSLLFQFIGGFVLVKALGLRRSHFLVPILLFSLALLSIVLPSFAALSFSYVLFKAIDFSLFGVIREMLYVPLQLDAKYRAKAIIDVFAYRTSKAVVSLGLLALQFVASSYLFELTGYISLAIFIGWLAVVSYLFRNQELAVR